MPDSRDITELRDESRATRPPFVAFDERQAVRIYIRNLPHWRQDGCAYFVTFRLGDSIPERVRKDWEYEKSKWLESRGIAYDGERGQWRDAFERLSIQEQLLFRKHFNRQSDACLDRGLGECWLNRPNILETVRARLLDHDQQTYHLGDFVVMPNHVHVLLVPCPGESLELVMKWIKGGSAVQCNRLLNRTGTFWQADSYDHIVRSPEELFFFREYIRENPAKAGIDVFPTALYRAQWMDAWP